jgi:hypothetical protein
MEQMESESAWKLWSDAAIVHPPSIRQRGMMSMPGQQPAMYVSGFLPRSSNSFLLYDNTVPSVSDNAKVAADMVARNEREFGSSSRSYSNHDARLEDRAGPAVAQKPDVWKEALRKQGLLTAELEETILKDSRGQEATNNNSVAVGEEARLGAATDEWLEDMAKLMLFKDKIKRMNYGQQDGFAKNSEHDDEPVMDMIQRSYRSIERDPEKEWQEIQNMLQVSNNMPEDEDKEKANEETQHDDEGVDVGRSTLVKYTSVNDGTDPQILHDDDDDSDIEVAAKSTNSAKRQAAEVARRRAVNQHDSYIMKMIKKLLSLDNNKKDDLGLASRGSFVKQERDGKEETASERLIRMMTNMDACLFDSRFCHECGGGTEDECYDDIRPRPASISTAVTGNTDTSSAEKKKPKEGMYRFLERMTSPSDAMVVATLVRSQQSSRGAVRSGNDGNEDTQAGRGGDNTTKSKSRRAHFKNKNSSMSYSSESSATSVSSATSANSSVSSSQYQTEVVLKGRRRGSKYSDSSASYYDRDENYHNDTNGSIISYFFEADASINGQDDGISRRRWNGNKKSSSNNKKYRSSSASERDDKKKARPKLPLSAMSSRLRRRAPERG